MSYIACLKVFIAQKHAFGSLWDILVRMFHSHLKDYSVSLKFGFESGLFVSYPYFAWSWFVEYILIHYNKKEEGHIWVHKNFKFLCVCVCVCVYIYIYIYICINLSVYNLCQYRAISVPFIHFQNINLFLPWRTCELCRLKKKNYKMPTLCIIVITCIHHSLVLHIPWSVLFSTQVIFVHGLEFPKFYNTASVAQFPQMSCPI